MTKILISRLNSKVFNIFSEELSIEQILNMNWDYGFKDPNMFDCWVGDSYYTLYLHEYLEKNPKQFSFNENEYIDYYSLTEEQFEFLKMKLL